MTGRDIAALAGTGSSRVDVFKRRLGEGETVLGAWLTIPELSVAEVMAGAGFDYVIVDAEHSPWTVGDVQGALSAFAVSDTVLLVRIPSHDAVFIKQVLDLGIDGIICPIVRTADEARQLVAECRYPPEGVRGYGPRRAAAYGRNQGPYTDGANASVMVIPQIEDAAYVDEVAEMVKVDGIDAICLGPTDLSGSLGVLRQFDHPDVVRALDQVMALSQAQGLAVCTGITLEADVQPQWVAKGARMALVTSDVSLLVGGAEQALAAVRSALA